MTIPHLSAHEMVMQQINTPLKKVSSYNGNLHVMIEMQLNMSHILSPYRLPLKPESQPYSLTHAYAQSGKLTIDFSTNGLLFKIKAFCFINKKHWTISEIALKQKHWTISEIALKQKQKHWTISETALKQKHWTISETA